MGCSCCSSDGSRQQWLARQHSMSATVVNMGQVKLSCSLVCTGSHNGRHPAHRLLLTTNHRAKVTGCSCSYYPDEPGLTFSPPLVPQNTLLGQLVRVLLHARRCICHWTGNCHLVRCFQHTFTLPMCGHHIKQNWKITQRTSLTSEED